MLCCTKKKNKSYKEYLLDEIAIYKDRKFNSFILSEFSHTLFSELKIWIYSPVSLKQILIQFLLIDILMVQVYSVNQKVIFNNLMIL